MVAAMRSSSSAVAVALFLWLFSTTNIYFGATDVWWSHSKRRVRYLPPLTPLTMNVSVNSSWDSVTPPTGAHHSHRLYRGIPLGTAKLLWVESARLWIQVDDGPMQARLKWGRLYQRQGYGGSMLRVDSRLPFWGCPVHRHSHLEPFG